MLCAPLLTQAMQKRSLCRHLACVCRDAHAKMPLDALVKHDDAWVSLHDIKHDSIRMAHKAGKEVAEFDGARVPPPTNCPQPVLQAIQICKPVDCVPPQSVNQSGIRGMLGDVHMVAQENCLCWLWATRGR